MGHFRTVKVNALAINVPFQPVWTILLEYGAAVFVYLVVIIATSRRENPRWRVLVVAIQVEPQPEDEVFAVVSAIRGVRHLGVPILVIVSLPNFNRLAWHYFGSYSRDKFIYNTGNKRMFTARKRSYGKVMFLHLSVILFTGSRGV